jgi:hypothetical protein
VSRRSLAVLRPSLRECAFTKFPLILIRRVDFATGREMWEETAKKHKKHNEWNHGKLQNQLDIGNADGIFFI